MSWAPVHLDDTVTGLQAGTLKRPSPTVGRLADGSHWLYAEKTNGLAGESGAGKTWTALRSVASELEDGNAAIYIDLEDNEIGVVGRLLSMGVDPDVLREPARFAYIHPNEGFAHGERFLEAALEHLKPTLVVIDSTGESMALDGCDPNSDDAVARWFQALPTRIARRGPAVLLLDHMPKASTGAASPIGSQRKRAALSGVQFIQEVKKGMAFAKGTPGEAVLTCTKDRHGHFMSGQPTMKLIVNPDAAGSEAVDVSLAIADPTSWAPTKHMAEISTVLEQSGPLSTVRICSYVTGKKDTIVKALGALVESGYLSLATGAHNAKEYSFVRPYKNGDPIVVPDEQDVELDQSGRPLCTEHEWHRGTWCKPGWCHDYHHGACNKN